MTAILILLWVLGLGVLVFGFWVMASVVGLWRARGVPFVALNKKQLQFLAENVKLDSGDCLVDLGCGDGRVLNLFAKQGVRDLVGYEVNLWAYVRAKLSTQSAKIYLRNFFKINLQRYNVVFCYLLDKQLAKLKEKFVQELQPGTKIISFSFAIPDWTPAQVINAGAGRKIYIYKIK